MRRRGGAARGKSADCPTAALIAKDPYVAYAKIAALFERLPPHRRASTPAPWLPPVRA
jgi:UDP-3-O-[3-hydroxymyristoyl] glucosamine N-acyltransferase